MDELRARIGKQGARYAEMPGTGPTGTTCKTCAALTYTGNQRKHPKCGRTAFTHGDATSILTSSPSCLLYAERDA